MGQFRKKVPISGRQKKILIQAKRQKNKQKNENSSSDDEFGDAPSTTSSTVIIKDTLSENKLSFYTGQTVKLNQQTKAGSSQASSRANRYNLEFCKDRLDAEFEQGKKEMNERILLAPPSQLECSSEDFFPEGLSFPKRPEGCEGMSREQLEMKENNDVRLFEEEMKSKFSSSDLNLFERNIETWRQLWRVCERSTVLLFITDIRFTVCQFPPYVYQYLKSKKKGIVLVLNKIDLVPSSLVIAWKEYFEDLYPDIVVVPFCSHESKTDKHRRARLALNSCKQLIEAVEEVTRGRVDLGPWRCYIEKTAHTQSLPESMSECELKKKRQRRREKECEEAHNQLSDSEEDTSADECEEEEKSDFTTDSSINPPVFTIGTIGYPNVGKSSLINAIMGKNMVGVSPTPGHTKHFQTHYLTPSKDMLLCDCPGLIFPAICPYKLQVLSGTFPISQVRVPMAVIGYLASHVNIQRVLSITLPEDYVEEGTPHKQLWTPYAIAMAWAQKRKFFTKGRGGRVDVSRAANELLRFSLNARNGLVLALKPKGYDENQDLFDSHEEKELVQSLQGIHLETNLLNEKLLSHAWQVDRSKKKGKKPF